MRLVFLAAIAASAASWAGSPEVSFKQSDNSMEILIAGRPFATYVWKDDKIPRPYFCQVYAPDGMQVTRHNPPDPVADKGNDDHPTFHPGIWLAFGDIDGADFWRNKAAVRHVRFEKEPVGGSGRGSFTVINSYETIDGKDVICQEKCTYGIFADETGDFLIADSEFSSDKDEFSFGDQEEMGFGMRINTPLTVKFGSGSILNSAGGKNEEGTWGKHADWCAFSGAIDGKQIGFSIMPAPDNFRPSWFHSRDYGLIVANPFGTKAMTGADDPAMPLDVTRVRKGQPFRLGFGVYIFSQPQGAAVDFNAAYQRYLALRKEK